MTTDTIGRYCSPGSTVWAFSCIYCWRASSGEGRTRHEIVCSLHPRCCMRSESNEIRVFVIAVTINIRAHDGTQREIVPSGCHNTANDTTALACQSFLRMYKHEISYSYLAPGTDCVTRNKYCDERKVHVGP